VGPNTQLALMPIGLQYLKLDASLADIDWFPLNSGQMQAQPLAGNRLFVLEPAVTDVTRFYPADPGQCFNQLLRGHGGFFDLEQQVFSLTRGVETQLFIDEKVLRHSLDSGRKLQFGVWIVQADDGG